MNPWRENKKNLAEGQRLQDLKTKKRCRWAGRKNKTKFSMDLEFGKKSWFWEKTQNLNHDVESLGNLTIGWKVK